MPVNDQRLINEQFASRESDIEVRDRNRDRNRDRDRAQD
jgi:hypothetical protein